jgi:uncharacterized membrane protein (UPF0127 family)
VSRAGRACAGAALALLLAACSSGSSAEQPAAAGSPATTASLPVERLVVGGVPLQVEVASTPQQRSDGLRGRTVVPAGTGMVFRYDTARDVRFTMSGVEPPLVAVFARAGRVVAVAQMAPCPGSLQECPTYGADTAVDTVVEAAPGSLPEVRVGDTVS